MGNMMDYLKWRGDLSFVEVPFNLADNLILSYLSYLDFTGIADGRSEYDCISVKDAADLYDLTAENQNPLIDAGILRIAADTRRYGHAGLWGYEEVTDRKDEMTQFAAIHIKLEDGTEYVSFRGTDNSIVGWREDFRIGSEVVPAQRRAAGYLERTICRDGSHCYRVGGHSKGGNLALYGVMKSCSLVKEQVQEIYMNDSPGLCPAMTEQEAYDKIAPKIIRLVPEFSIIGRLFTQEPPDKIVKSSAEGVLQHDVLSWQIEGAAFVEAEALSAQCRLYNEIFDQWIESADMEQRKAFTRDFFDALEAGGATTMSEVMTGRTDGFEAILMAMIKSERDSKIVAGKLIRSFWQRVSRIDYLELLKEKKMLQGVTLFVIGVIFVVFPQFALQIIGTVFFLWLLAFAVLRLLHYRSQYRNGEMVEKVKIVFYGAIAGLEIMCIVKNNIIVLSSNLVLAIFFLMRAYKRAKVAVRLRKEEKVLFFMSSADAVLTVCFSIVAFSAADTVKAAYLMTAGTYLIIVALAGIGKAMQEHS